MKKISILMLSMSMAGIACAQNSKTGEVDITIPQGVEITETNPEILARKYLPRVSKKTTWVITRDDTDNMGIRTIDCAQYVDGVAVAGREIILHYRDGKLLFITGMVATRPMTDPIVDDIPSASYGKGMWVANGNSTSVAPKYTIRVVDGVAHTAYSAVKGTDKVYYDSKTGEEIDRVTLIKKAVKASNSGTDVQGKGSTFFYGEKEMTVTQLADGKYALHDNARKIYTVDGSPYTLTELQGVEADNGEYPLSAYGELTSTTSDFGTAGGLKANLKTVVLSNFGSEFNTKFNAGNKYVYLAILDKDGVVKKTSDVMAVSTTNDDLTVLFSDPFTFVDQDKATIDAQQADAITKYSLGVYLSSTNATNGEKVGEGTIVYQFDKNKLEISDVCNATLNFQIVGFQPALDVHWGLEKVMDYHKAKFNRTSFDNKGTQLIARIDQGDGDNAAATPPADNYTAGYMEFGMGNIDPTDFESAQYPCVDLETIGHEFNHLVARKLEYQGESGALDESYADIMGKNIEHYAFGTTDWEASQILYLNKNHKCMRSFSDPINKSATPSPACYKGAKWASTKVGAPDNGGVHSNSCVQNHWFYLMCEGGTVTPEKTDAWPNPQAVIVTKVDRDKMEQIAFYALVNYGTANLTYSMARKNSIKVAQEKYPSETDLVTALNAGWDAVGVPETSAADNNPSAVANGKVSVNKSRFPKNEKNDGIKGDDLVLACDQGITIAYPEDKQECTFGIMFLDLTESTETEDVYWLSDRATVDSSDPSTTPIKKITVEIPEDLEVGHKYDVVPIYWFGVDESLSDDKYWDEVDKVMDTVAFPRGYNLPEITIEGSTAINGVSSEKSEGKDGKYLNGSSIVIKKSGKQYSAAGQQM